MPETSADSLGRRAASALVLVPLVIVAAAIGGWLFTAVVVLAAALMAFEWDRLCGGEKLGPLGALGTAVALVSLGTAGAGYTGIALLLVAAGSVTALVLAPMLGRGPLWAMLGVIYVSLPCVALVWLRAIPDSGLQIIVWLLAVVWATDTGAYFAGRGIGGPRLAPRISPSKTWAGLAGGMVLAALAGAGVGWITGVSRIAPLAVVSAGLAVIEQVGDLAESWIKRHFGVKDSGNVIPGHGGVLDRVDGLLFATLAVGGLALLGGGHLVAWQ